MKKTITFFLYTLIIGFVANAQPIVLQPDTSGTDDAFISSANPSTNYGTNNFLYYGQSTWNHDTLNTYIRFDLSSITPGTTVNSTRIDFCFGLVNGWITGNEYAVYQVTDNWDEHSITWDSYPASDTNVLYSFTGDEYQEIPYMPFMGFVIWRSVYLPDTVVQKWVDNPSLNNGILIKCVSGFGGYPYMWSSENGTAVMNPRIVINSNNVRISGTVTDANTSAHVSGLMVEALDPRGIFKYASDSTNSNGDYFLDVVYPGNYIVRVNGKTGYLPYTTDSFTVAEGVSTVQNIQLTPEAHAVSGTVSGLWSVANSPYIISNEVIVNASTELVIEPGVMVEYAGPYGLNVYGFMKAEGTASDSIIFTSYDTLKINKGRGVRFYDADSSVLDYCRIENMFSFDYSWGTSSKDPGGGIFASNTGLMIQHCNIRRNSAQSGGGIYIGNYTGSKKCIISRNLVEGNTSNYWGNTGDGGGGIWVGASGGNETMFINNNIIINNEAKSKNGASNHTGGGGLQIMGGKIRVMNNTIVFNKGARGAGINANFYEGKILNNIIWGNTGARNNEQVALDNGNMGVEFEASYNCLQDTGIIYQTLDDTTGTPVPGTGNIYTYPEFTDTLTYLFSLTSSSPCIDAGSNQYLYFPYDYQDMNRISDGDGDGNGIVDIGAYEYGTDTILVLDLGPDYGVCYDTSNTVAVNPAEFDFYQWSTGDTTSYTHILSTGYYYVTVSDSLGCFAIDSIYITSYTLPYVDLGKDTAICPGSAFTIDGGTSGSCLWNTGDTTQTIEVDTAGTYIVLLTNSNTCVYTDSIAVSLHPLPFINLSGDTAVCSDNITLDAGPGFDSYLWNNSDITQTSYITSSGDYFVFVTDSFGCGNYSDTINVELYPVPVITLPDTTIPLVDGSVILDAGDGFAEYHWSNGATTHLIVVFGNYFGVGTHLVYVTVTTQDGCTATGEAVIHVYNNVGVNEYNNLSVSVYPNPAENTISIYGLNENEENQIRISDGCGKIVAVQNLNITGTKTDIDVSQLSPGIYFVRITGKSGTACTRFIKQ
jgi:hypothetical protein